MADSIPTKTKTETLADIATAKAAANASSSKWTGEKFGSPEHSDADLIALTLAKMKYVDETATKIAASVTSLKTEPQDLERVQGYATRIIDIAKYGPKAENVESNADKLTNTGTAVTTTDDQESSAGMGLK